MPSDDQPKARITGIAPPGRGLPGIGGTRGFTAHDRAREHGHLMAKAHPEKAAGYLRAVRGGDIRPTADARARASGIEAELAAQQRCRECGRTLTDPESIEAGIGPDCAKTEERP